ncbi:T9SS type B sorting domain-containing protein [Chitinophaga sp. SYP-B3965]|uniref:Calx-beta domain-containing protein n=1 Tax=Chitinophaga sp. SYP-B3965 TaxID=2663120 RepID=UPI001299F82D|nr:Calx-beta domain-containing protein [Chitinophaga sp. SYP-B3965]MRG44598.1 T9SS type B sorting domain-containing protein [Chitinophaga sp. SYP-B3965]
MKKLILLSILLLFVSRLYAADYYWVGGTGNWSETTHWASVSGGTPNKSIVPGANDDVYFDGNSGLAAGMTVTLPTGAHAYCRNMSWAGVTTAAIFRNNVTTFQLQVSGNVELSSTVRYAMSSLNFVGTSNATYKTNGAVRLGVGYYNPITINKGTGSLTILDGINENTAVSNIVLYTGLLNMSGQTHTIGSLSAGGATVRSVNISNANITCLTAWDTRGSNLTLTATASTITADMFYSTGLTFDKVFANRDNPDMDINNNTFNELTLASLVSQIGTQRIGANNIIGRLEFKSGGRIAGAGNVIGQLILAPGKGYIFHGNNTINTSMLANTADCDALGELRGADANARLTFGAGATADIRNVLITSLTAAGSIAPITVVGVDGGSNTGFNITPRTGGNTTLFWVGGAGDWDDRAHWSTSSGGTGGACVPFSTDNVVFDANSGFTNASKTVSVTNTARCHDMTWTNVTNAPILNIGGYTMEIWGSLELDPTMTFTGTNTPTIRGIYLLKGTEASTFTSKGCNLGAPLINVDKTGPIGGLTITDNLTFPACSLRVANGKLLMPGRTVNIAEIRSQTNTVRTIDFSNTTITVNDWLMDSRNATSVNNGAGSFITAKVWFSVNGFTYPKVYSDATLNSVNITGTTIGELVFTNTSPTTAVIALNGNGGNTIGTMDVRCGRVVFQGTNTINNLLLAPSRTYYFKGTQTITGLFRFNSPDCNGLGELRDLDGTPAILSFGASSTRDFNNVYLLNITATGSGVPISVSGADAGGNTGFNITPSAAGPRYWVGGSGDWNESLHWSNTPNGTGGACVPTVANDVYFDASSFTSGSSTVSISNGNAYCRNMDWTGATFAPVFNKASNSLTLEVWGNLTLNNTVAINAQLYFVGTTNSTFTSNGNTSGNLDMFLGKSTGYSLRFTDNFSNPQTRIDIRNGGLDLSDRTIALDAISDGNQNGFTTINITNATLNIAAWEYQGANKSLQSAGSIINTAGYFAADDAAYNIVNTGLTNSNYVRVASISAKEFIFTNPATTSGAYILGGNTIGKLEFKGKGYIGGTGNTIDTLIFSPGKVYNFLAGSNTTITKEWFGSGTPCNLTEISSLTAAPFTVTKAGGQVLFDYVRLRNITAAGITPFKALEHSENLGGNTNWDIAPYNGSTPILGLGPDFTLCANEFPHTLNTDGFFASPLATITWGDGSTGKTLVVNGPGTYSVTVSYPDGCTRPDNIVITRSTVTVDPVTGTAAVCVGNTTTLSSTTPGGVWSTSDAAIATVSATGVVSGVTAGSANIIYTVTNGDGCSNSQQLAVTVNAIPVVPAITGTLNLFQGATTTLSNTTPAGVWSSSNTAVATVDGGGVVTGVAGGTADITYTVTNASGCVASQTVTVTVDAFPPAKRVLSITKTADASEPVTDGGFSINLPAGVLAVENINITYTVSGTATAPGDYATLSGTAVIAAGQNGVPLPVSIVNDAQIESLETVIVTLSAGNSTNYTYTIDGVAGNATAQITDDDDVPANRFLSVTSQLNADEPTNTGTFTIALPSGVLAPENITVTYVMSGSAASGTEYQTLPGTIIIPAGQNSVVINVNALDDQIIEQTKDIILTISGGTTATAGNFSASATNGAATLLQADNDYTTATRLLSVTSNGNTAEAGTNSSFTISLPAGYTSSLPITVTCTLTGTATNGADYNGPSTTIILPAGQTSVPVPLSVVDDGLIELTETVILTITNGVATQGASTVFTLSPDAVNGSATINIADNDNTAGNKTIAVTATNAAEPSTSGSFTFSLPPGVFASENTTVNYTVSGTATPVTDYTTLSGSVVIPAGQHSVQIALNVRDEQEIENTETVIVTVTGGTSTNFTYTPSATNPATANIADNDATANSTVVLLTKVSDAIEGDADGQYRISFPPGVTSSEDVTVNFTPSGTATSVADYSITGFGTLSITIPAGVNAVFVNVDALADATVEGPETVILTLNSATSASHTFTIDPAGNGAVVNIVDINATSLPPMQVDYAGATTATEGLSNATFTVKLDGVSTSSWPVTVAYKVTGTATSGLDYQSFGTVTIPPGQNSVLVTLNVINDEIIEPTETMIFTILSGSSYNGVTAYLFPADPANDQITLNIDDNDAAARILRVVKTADAAEPGTRGSYTISLPTGYTASANMTLHYTMSAGSATRNTDYSISMITLLAYQNSVIIPLNVINDQIMEGTETATLTLDAPNAGTDGNTFTYTRDPASFTADLDITDDDNTAANKTLSAVAGTPATEGGANSNFTIKLPNGVTAGTDITVNYTISGTAVNGTDYTNLTGTATILAGQNDVLVPVIVTNDLAIEQTETVVLTITGGTAGAENYTPETGNESASVNIVDNDDIAANKTLRIVRTAHAAEPLTNGGFRIELEAGAGITSSEDITVNYTIATGATTATNGTDYTTLSGSIVLPAGSNSVLLPVLVKDDQLIESLTETVTLTITGGTSASYTFTPSAIAASRTTSLNITDDDNNAANKVLTLTKTADAAEPGTNGNYRISLPPNVYCQVNIIANYFINASSTAIANTDYTNLASIVIPAGSNYVDIPVKVIDDNRIEQTETIILALSGTSTAGLVGGPAWSLPSGPVTMNILDDDNTPANRHVNLTMGYEGTEGGAGQLGRIRFNFSLPLGIAPSETITINYTLSGTAALSADFNGYPTAAQFSGTAQLSSTGTGGTSSVGAVVDDNIIEGTEDVVVTINSVTSPNFTYTFGPAATARIFDNDNAPANLELSVTKTADAVESGAVGKFTISLPGTTTTSTEAITVNYTIAGTATNGTDYTNLTGTVVIPANTHSVDVDVTAAADQILEGLETVTLTITGGQSTSFTFTPAAANSATVDITDADNTPANLTLSISKVSDAAERSTPGFVKFSLPANIVAAQDITVNYTVAGTATPDADYAALSGTAIIKAGDDGVTIPVPVIDDQIIEPLETVIITLTGGNGAGLVYTGAGDVTVNIADDDNTPDNLVLKVIKDADATEQGTPGNFIVSLPDGVTSTEDITVNYIISGTATTTDDYNDLIGSVVITAGTSSANVPVTAVNDLVIEGTETVILEVTGGSQTGGVTFVPGPDKTASLDIIDDDQDPVNMVLNIAQDLDGAEPGTNGRFIISLPFGVTSSEDITVSYTVNGTATPGSDYTALTGTIIIPANNNSIQLPVAVQNDDIIEPTETVIATLAGGSSTNLTFTGTTSATVNITDDESTIPANLELTVTKGSDATEGGTDGSFVISLAGTVRAANDITVNYTIGGTATQGSDYTVLSGTAVIRAGDASVTVPVTAQDDDILEVSETVILTLNGGTGAGITYTGTGNATVNITDNENTPANLVLNVAANGDVSEAAAGAGFIISLPNNIKTATDLTVNYTIAGTAINGTDYALLNGTAVILAGNNSVAIQISGIDDQIIEGNETIELTITNGSATGIVLTPGANSTASIDLIDDDNNLDIVVSATPSVTEPSTAGKFTISLAGGKAPAKDVTVTYTITGTATSGTDYTALSSSAVIPAGSTSVDVDLTVLEDELIEPTETVIMTINGGSSTGLTYTVGAQNTATINITDNDATGNLVLEVTASQPNATEPATHGEFTISIANGKRTAEPLTIQYTISGTAVAGTDYQAINTITIPAGENSITVPVQVTDDMLIEDPETVILNISGGQSTSFNYTAGAANQATVTITSEDIPAGDLTITKELVAPAAGPYRLGQEITYRITVSNIGNGLASGVVVTDTLAMQLGLPSGTTPERGTVNITANRLVIWTIGDVTPGATVQLEIRCRITEGGELVVGSEVGSGSLDPDMTNNKAFLRLQIEGQDLNFPNVFTPNGDGKNEKFVIGGIEKYPGAKLQVFNRWGGQVYRSNDYRNDWNGSGLNEGTYFYILEVNKPDGIKSYKGWVLIVR